MLVGYMRVSTDSDRLVVRPHRITLPWPAPVGLVMRFIAHHLWDPAQREKDPEHGMLPEVAAALLAQDLLRVAGPHAPSTVKRRLAHWGTLHRWRGIAGPFNSPHLRTAI